MAIPESACISVQDILERIEEYFDDRADADCEGDPPRYVPNEEMQLYTALQEARAWIDQLIRDNGKAKQ